MAPDRPVVREWGAPAGRPLLFWPGLSPWGSLQLLEVGPLLADRGWWPELEPRYRAGMTERARKIVPRATARAAAWALHGVASEPPSSIHSQLALPVLLVLASDRPNPEALARFRAAVPHAEVAVLDSGHDIPEDAPRELADLVAERLG